MTTRTTNAPFPEQPKRRWNFRFKANRLRRSLLLSGAGLLFAVMISEAQGAAIKLAWDLDAEPAAAGYRVYYGTLSGIYTRTLDVGKKAFATIADLVEGRTYFFAVTAYNAAGVESVPSEEIAYPSSDTLRNISTRAFIQTGDQVLIGGFLVGGNGQKRVAVRALGQSIPIQGALSNPMLELYNGTGRLVATNDNWRTSQPAALIATGIAPQNAYDSMLLTTLRQGSYTVVVRGKQNATGIGLVEVYDLDNPRHTVQLGNVSTRGGILTGDNILIGGFIVGGGDKRTSVLVRALGPSLASYGLPNALSDPTLELHNGNGALIAANDNWLENEQAGAVQATNIPPSSYWESAITMALAPGNYTAVVRGKGGKTGVGLVEVYDLH